jgi:HEAT repeat protein
MKRILFLVIIIPVLVGCGSKPVTVGGQPVSHWLDALKDRDPKQRLQAVKALGRVGAADPAALPALAAALKDADPKVRAGAVVALVNMGPAAKDAVPALEEAQQDPDPTVRAFAEKAVKRFSGG